MLISNFINNAHMFIFAILLAKNTVLGGEPVHHICSKGKYTPDGAYASNVNQVITSLISTTPDSGFGVQTSGAYPDQAHGFARCTGNLRNQECRTCLQEAGREVRNRCPTNLAGIIWYDDCMLKYSHIDVYIHSSFYQCNPEKITLRRRRKFREARLALFDVLVRRPTRPNLYAAYDIEIKGTQNQRIYGFSQCNTQFLIPSCYSSLQRLSRRLNRACRGRVGGKYYTESCNMRYELYPFAHAQ